MKIHPFINAFIIALIFCQCNAKKKTVSGSKTVTIEFAEVYCGGAAPPDEMIKEMSKMKPMANMQVEVYINHNPDCKAKIYKTNELGQITLSPKLGNEVFINVYPPAEEFKADQNEYLCYKGFIMKHLLAVDLSKPETEIKINTLINCNPCIPAAP